MNTKGERLLHEIEYIRMNQPISASKIGEYFGVSKNTVKDDVQLLKHFGCEFEASDGRSPKTHSAPS